MDKNIKLELAKSWFVMAQISVILGCFFFASAGISYNNVENTIYKMNDVTANSFSFQKSIIDSANQECYLNKSDDNNVYTKLLNISNEITNASMVSLHDLYKVNSNLWQIYEYIGTFFVLCSIFFFFVGRSRLQKISSN